MPEERPSGPSRTRRSQSISLLICSKTPRKSVDKKGEFVPARDYPGKEENMFRLVCRRTPGPAILSAVLCTLLFPVGAAAEASPFLQPVDPQPVAGLVDTSPTAGTGGRLAGGSLSQDPQQAWRFTGLMSPSAWSRYGLRPSAFVGRDGRSLDPALRPNVRNDKPTPRRSNAGRASRPAPAPQTQASSEAAEPSPAAVPVAAAPVLPASKPVAAAQPAPVPQPRAAVADVYSGPAAPTPPVAPAPPEVVPVVQPPTK